MQAGYKERRLQERWKGVTGVVGGIHHREGEPKWTVTGVDKGSTDWLIGKGAEEG